MKILWAPWRIEYIKMKKPRGCFFCKEGKGKQGKFPLVLKTEHSIVLMNTYPYNPGHVMVAPKRHVPDITDLSKEEFCDLWETVKLMELVIKKVFSPDGMNIGVNLGKAAGAGIVDHLHVHIVPRWIGDNNFMPVVSDTRIISQAIQESFQLIVDELKRHKNQE